MAKTAGGQILPDLNEELKERILTSALLNTKRVRDHDMWTAHKTPKGYGRMTVRWKGERFTMNAHRAIWAATHGKWPNRFQDVDHTCGEESCVNPAHLKLVKATEHSGAVRRNTGWKNQFASR